MAFKSSIFSLFVILSISLVSYSCEAKLFTPKPAKPPTQTPAKPPGQSPAKPPAQGTTKPPGSMIEWKTMDVTDKHVMDIASLAVTKYNKFVKRAALKFTSVLKAEVQEIYASSGINKLYNLVISAKSGLVGKPKSYEFVILINPKNGMQVIASFDLQ